MLAQGADVLGEDSRAVNIRGHGGPRRLQSGRERSSTTTRLRGLGIHEDESLLHQRFLIIQDHAVQINERLRVDEHAHVVELKDAIAFARLRVETDVIAETRTATTLHAKAQSALLGRNAFLGHRAAYLNQGFVSDLNAL